jgi:hypothetical protein
MIYKNGVPIGYFEGLRSLNGWKAASIFITRFEGETAWLYANILNVMRRSTGVSSFSLDPYQIGFENEEGIQSERSGSIVSWDFVPLDDQFISSPKARRKRSGAVKPIEQLPLRYVVFPRHR